MNIVKPWLMAIPALAFAASLAWVLPALAQQSGAPDRAGGVTMAQFVARQSARIMAADTDGDGRVSRAEIAAMSGMGAGPGVGKGHDPERRFDAMDTNHDGYLDKDEIRLAFEQRFHRMDANGDGILTPDERMAARARHEPPTSASMPAGMAAASQP